MDLAHFTPKRKQAKVAFLGRLEREKGALTFVHAALEASRRLEALGIAAKFNLYGAEGDESNRIRRCLAGHPEAPIYVDYADDPKEALADAKVFVSLQRNSNYPSKALAEAMACGCVPVVTDAGESRLMVDSDLAEFVAKDCSPDEVASAIVRLLTLPHTDYEQRSQAVRCFAERRFKISVQAEYYAKLYREAS